MYDIINDITSIHVFIKHMISYTISQIRWYHIWYHIHYDNIITISYQNLWYHIWYHTYPFLALQWYWKKVWYHIWYHRFWCDIILNIIKTIIKYVSCAIFIRYCLRYHTSSYVIAYDIIFNIKNSRYQCTYRAFSPKISRTRDIIAVWYLIFVWYLSQYHGTWATERRKLGAHPPGSPPPCIANVLGTSVWDLPVQSTGK